MSMSPRPAKYSADQARVIDQGTKVIYKYPTPTPDLDIGRMVVNGRHPQDPQTFVIEHTCSFVMYILKGTGKVYTGDAVFEVAPQDVVFIPNETKFAIEGSALEYITVDSPAFSPGQSEMISN